MMYELRVDKEKCTGCGNCVISCPVNALDNIEICGGKGVEAHILVGNSKAEVKEQSFCNGCGVCVTSCPFGAIVLVPLALEPFSKTMKIDEMPMVGMEALVYGAIKEGEVLTMPEVSEELNAAVREVMPHISKLKLDDQIQERGLRGEDHLYTADMKEKNKDAGKKKKVVRPKLDPKAIKRIKEPLEAVMSSMSKLKVRMLIEKGDIQKAKEAVEKERGEG